MARVRELFPDSRSSQPHPTEVEGGWQILTDSAGNRIFQLSTYGSDDRISEKKVSQTIQLDKTIARELVKLMIEHLEI